MLAYKCTKCGNVVYAQPFVCQKCGASTFEKETVSDPAVLFPANEKPEGNKSQNPGEQPPPIPVNKFDHRWKTKRVIGILFLTFCFLNIALSIIALIVYKGDVPYCPGDSVKENPFTSEQVYWGIFYASGEGSIIYAEKPPDEFSNIKWTVTSRDLHGTSKKNQFKLGDWTMSKSRMLVNILVPDVDFQKDTYLNLQVVIHGYTIKQVNSMDFVYRKTEMTSEPFTLHVAPSSMKWLVHQHKFIWLSLIVAYGWIYWFVNRKFPLQDSFEKFFMMDGKDQ